MKTRKIRVRVTEKDIKEGARCNALSCPIARAMKKKLRFASVDNFGYKIWSTGRPRNFPRSNISRWITDFDLGRKVKPTSFTIEVPENMLR